MVHVAVENYLNILLFIAFATCGLFILKIVNMSKIPLSSNASRRMSQLQLMQILECFSLSSHVSPLSIKEKIITVFNLSYLYKWYFLYIQLRSYRNVFLMLLFCWLILIYSSVVLLKLHVYYEHESQTSALSKLKLLPSYIPGTFTGHLSATNARIRVPSSSHYAQCADTKSDSLRVLLSSTSSVLYFCAVL